MSEIVLIDVTPGVIGTARQTVRVHDKRQTKQEVLSSMIHTAHRENDFWGLVVRYTDDGSVVHVLPVLLDGLEMVRHIWLRRLRRLLRIKN